MRKLYIGNLSWDVVEMELEDWFGKYGDIVSVKVIKDRATGKSRGFSFVEFTTEDAAKEALEAENGNEFRGRKLIIREAIEKPRNQEGFNRDNGVKEALIIEQFSEPNNSSDNEQYTERAKLVYSDDD